MAERFYLHINGVVVQRTAGRSVHKLGKSDTRPAKSFGLNSMSMAKNVDETSVLGCLAALLKNFDHVKSGNCVTSRRKSSNLAGNSFEALSHQPKRTKATKKETLFTSVALAKIVGSPC